MVITNLPSRRVRSWCGRSLVPAGLPRPLRPADQRVADLHRRISLSAVSMVELVNAGRSPEELAREFELAGTGDTARG
jgi:hypothetical protein